MSEKMLNKKCKDSVFVKLFQDKKYILQMYKEMHPEDKDVRIEDIEIKTLESFVLINQYNDLGFTVKDKLVILIEAQSKWNLNILIRMLLYIVDTFRIYLDSTEQSVHQSSKVKLPFPELYVFYPGKEKRPEVISLNEEFFGGKSCIDLKIKIMRKVDKTLSGQYIGFCRVFDENRKKYKDALEAAKATFRECIDKGYLAEFMIAHELEVVDMMSELFDVEYMTKQYNRAMQREKREAEEKIMKKGIEKGIEKGMEKGMAKGEENGLKKALKKMIESGIEEETAKKILGM